MAKCCEGVRSWLQGAQSLEQNGKARNVNNLEKQVNKLEKQVAEAQLRAAQAENHRQNLTLNLTLNLTVTLTVTLNLITGRMLWMLLRRRQQSLISYSKVSVNHNRMSTISWTLRLDTRYSSTRI